MKKIFKIHHEFKKKINKIIGSHHAWTSNLDPVLKIASQLSGLL